MTRPDERPPTLQEAAEWLARAATPQYARACLKEWREKYGEKFAERAETMAKKK